MAYRNAGTTKTAPVIFNTSEKKPRRLTLLSIREPPKDVYNILI
jgi:hypothetical protein